MVQDQGVGGGEGLGILKFYNFFSLKHSLSYLEPENQKSSKFWSFEKLLGGWWWWWWVYLRLVSFIFHP